MDDSQGPRAVQKRMKFSNLELDSLNVRDLFIFFNETHFRKSLLVARVRWSATMTSRAGACLYDEEKELCTIILSAPVLTQRPRSDLVETLLHEMIHAYLFVTKNTKDTEDHGPEFLKHAKRIKEEAGIDIHTHCNFLNEINLNINHVWRCSGPCKDQHPHFGFVMRTANRPPGPSDSWWHKHLRECGGEFKKIPSKGKHGKNKKKNGKGKHGKTGAGAKGARILIKNFGPENPSGSKPSDASSSNTAADDSDKGKSDKGKSDKGEGSKSNKQNVKKPGNSKETEGEPGTSRASDDIESKPSTSRAGDDFESKPSTSQAGDENVPPKPRPIKKKVCKGKKRKSTDDVEPEPPPVDEKKPTVSCPICNHPFGQDVINEHVNACMEEQDFMNEISPDEDNEHGHPPGQCPLLTGFVGEDEASERIRACLYFYIHDEEIAGDDEPGADKVCCPCCWKWVKEGKINEHIDACLTYNTLQNNPDSP